MHDQARFQAKLKRKKTDSGRTTGDLKEKSENSAEGCRNKRKTSDDCLQNREYHHADADFQHQFRSIQKNGSEG